MSTLLILVLVIWFVRWSTLGWGTRGSPELAAAQADEIRRLREEVDQLNAQMLRLGDEQAFMMRLLTEGSAPPAAGLPPGGDAGAAPETEKTEIP
ncbi:MAG TPA: hypothetical protein VHG91_08555 [Longimicrobium sp.]|nr:hypothetical protein [Longimicrobium sp.]